MTIGQLVREGLREAPRENRLLAALRLVRELAASRPDMKLVWLDAPHFILQCCPDVAAAEIERFFDAATCARG